MVKEPPAILKRSGHQIQMSRCSVWCPAADAFAPGDDEATPEGIAVLNDLNFVLIADTCEHVIRVFDDQENPVSIWGSFGVGAGAFDSPCAISVHVSTGLVVVADRGNNRIQVKLMVICELSS